ncbi:MULTISPECIES: BTAD domain-containing putative transcriptional regulator [unclassified Roseibium]|uniref:BTAD domain-containing putative transcriptional regulator n=1 Tax=unclassified Roseibium TaxID=2629323 RepID=UPI00273F48F8|nr:MULTISPECIES: BTAD domain-containing putative transcriptional regulator [unclassified Roseibium]
MTIPVPHFAGLGRPMLKGADGDPVATKTRKALAILGYVSRISDLSASREAVADLLWSSATGHRGMQSLRQALKQLKTAEEIAGLDVVKTQGGHIQIYAGSLPTDLAFLLDLLNTSDSPDFNTAIALWRGDYLTGFEDIDPVFTDWLLIERQRIRDEVMDATLKHLSGAVVAAATPGAEAAAHFLLHMDPAFEPAHRALIQIYLHRGQRERAEQQLRACERELSELDGVPEQETRDLLSATARSGPSNAQLVLSRPQNPEFWQDPDGSDVTVVDHGSDNVIHFPKISIVSSELARTAPNDGIYLREEIVSGLSAYRSFDLFQSDYFGDAEGPPPVLVQGDDGGNFLLRFQHNDRSGRVLIQFEDRAEGRIVFSEVVDLQEWDGIENAASHTIGRIYSHVTNKLRNPKNSSAFARWCQAEALMVEFDPKSDRKALQILEEISKRHSTFSMSYSGKALVNIKQLLHYRVEDRDSVLSWDEIMALCEHAVKLDPWQPINLRTHGWALIQSGLADEARRSFMQAIRLNSVDPINLISAAEGLAFAGEVELARSKAEKAMNLFTTVPRVFYEYYSLVFFASEDFETAAKIIERASYKSIVGLTTRVAALVCAGKDAEALDLLSRHSESLAKVIDQAGLGTGDPDEWGRRINFFQDPKTRASYDRGVQLVKRYFFGDRAAI